MLYIGGGAVQSNASSEVRELLKLLKIPTTQTLMGLGAISMQDPHFIGMLGMHGTYEANMAMHHSDLIICLGARFDDRTTNDPTKYCPDAKIIHIDIDPASIGKIIEAYVPIVGNLKYVVAQMCEHIKNNNLAIADEVRNEWWQKIDYWRNQYGIYKKPNYQLSTENLIKPKMLLNY